MLPHLLGTGSCSSETLSAPGRVQVLLLGIVGLRGGGDALDGWHWPGHPQEPLRGATGDGAPQGNSSGASPRILRG